VAQQDGPTRTRGRPRSEATHKAILDAAIELLAKDDYRAISMDRIAEAATVSKQTIYRWWNSKPVLLLEAFLARTPNVGARTRATGDVIEDIRNQLVQLFTSLREPVTAKCVRSLIAEAQLDTDFRQHFYQALIGQQREGLRQILLRGLAKGQLKAGLDTETILDLLYGSVLYRLTSGTSEPLDDRFASNLILVLEPAIVLSPGAG
jgi:AcrR family transcriptional regulator